MLIDAVQDRREDWGRGRGTTLNDDGAIANHEDAIANS